MSILKFEQLPADCQAALLSYAKENGRKWKNALELQWYHARVRCERDSILHGLRNSPNFGNAGLQAVKLPKA